MASFACGLNVEGGNRNHVYGTRTETPALAESPPPLLAPQSHHRLSSEPSPFFNLATYLDQLPETDYEPNGGKSLHVRSHGESFLALFLNKFKPRQSVQLTDFEGPRLHHPIVNLNIKAVAAACQGSTIRARKPRGGAPLDSRKREWPAL